MLVCRLLLAGVWLLAFSLIVAAYVVLCLVFFVGVLMLGCVGSLVSLFTRA